MTIQDKDLLIVGVPEHHKCLTINLADDGKKIYLFVESPGTRYEISYDLPEGNWEPVGLYPGLTEEQALTLMEDKTLSTHGYFHSHSENKVWENTALESFASRIEALGAYIKNPMGEEKPFNWMNGLDYEDKEEWNYIVGKRAKWNNYQSRTSGQWLVLMKK